MTSVLDAPSVLDADPATKAARRDAARATLGVSGLAESEPLSRIIDGVEDSASKGEPDVDVQPAPGLRRRARRGPLVAGALSATP